MIISTSTDDASSRAKARTNALLEAGLNRLSTGFGLFDADLALVAWNTPFGSLRGYPQRLLQAGTPLADLLRFNAELGDYGAGDAGKIVQERIDAAREGKAEQSQFTLPDGRTLKVESRPFPGGLLLTVEDVTEQEQATRALHDNEERYALLADAVEEGLYDWRIDRDKIYVSPRLQKFFRFEVGELGPKDWNWNSRIHREDLQHYLDALSASFRGETHRWRCEYRFCEKEGSYRWVLDHGHLIRDDDGEPVRLVGAIRDIDKGKQAEEALRRSEARYELALEAINEGVYDWDIVNRQVFYSDRVYKVLGLTPDILASPDDWLKRIHPDDLEGYRRATAAHLKAETDRFEHTFRYLDADGNWRWALQHGIALRDGAGRAYRMIGSTGDITELKEKERQLAEKSAILETTLENIDQGISMVDSDLRTITFNSRFLELLDLPPERFSSGFHMEEALRYNAERGEYGPGDVEEQVQERLELAGRFEPHAFERTRPDHTVIAIRGKPLPGGGFVSTYTDITEQRRTEAALRDNEERYALASQAATEGIYDWNVETGTLYLTDRAKEFFAFPSKPLTPSTWNARVHPEDFEGYRQVLIDHMKGRTPSLEHEYRIRDAEGGYRWILDRGVGIRNEHGRVIRLVGAVSDVTSRKLAEMELRRTRDAAQAATRAKSNFLANMSHELRTPLNAVIGFTRIVMRRSQQALDARQYENLEKILSSAEHLLTLINSVLDLSKIEAERVDIEPADLELAPFVDRCLQTVEPLVDQSRVALTRYVDPDLPVIYTDEEKVRQILINLLGNAVKFTEQGRISISARRRAHAGVEIAISDTGIGIPRDSLSRIFDEFSQVDSSSTREYGGTGLGLSIGRRLAQVLGGDIRVQSRESEGSTFTLELPLRYEPASPKDSPPASTEARQ